MGPGHDRHATGGNSDCGFDHIPPFLGRQGVELSGAAQRNESVDTGGDHGLDVLGVGVEIDFRTRIHWGDEGGEDTLEIGFQFGWEMSHQLRANCIQMFFNSVFQFHVRWLACVN
jgi:hypothetical protein